MCLTASATLFVFDKNEAISGFLTNKKIASHEKIGIAMTTQRLTYSMMVSSPTFMFRVGIFSIICVNLSSIINREKCRRRATLVELYATIYISSVGTQHNLESTDDLHFYQC
jgi:hypothetical protein